MDYSRKELLEKLEQMILEEAWIQRDALERQLKLPLRERIRIGKAIEGLCLAGVNDRNGNLIFTCDENNSLFRTGDYLVLHKSSPLLEDGIACILESDEERYIEVSVSFGDARAFEKNEADWMACSRKTGSCDPPALG